MPPGGNPIAVKYIISYIICRGNTVDFDSVEVSPGTPANLTDVPVGVSSIHLRSWRYSASIGKDYFPPYPFQFVRHQSSYYRRQYWRRHRI